MAIVINTGLTTTDGGTVESGAFVKFHVTFPMEGFRYNANFNVWRSESAHDNGLEAVQVSEIENNFFIKELTPQEYTGLTPIVIHTHLQAHIEQYIGSGTTEIKLV